MPPKSDRLTGGGGKHANPAGNGEGSRKTLAPVVAPGTAPSPGTASQQQPQQTAHCKLVLLGEAAVGKSSLVLRFVSNDFQENKEPTIGAAFLTQKCRLDDKTIKFEIWDTAGQERFHSLAPMYYRNAQAAVVVYDVTKAVTLVKAQAWIKELQRQASQGIIIALAGNKVDLVERGGRTNGNGENNVEEEEEEQEEQERATREVDEQEAREYAEKTGLIFFETSAKTGLNVQKIFTEIAKALPEESLANSARGARFGSGLEDESIDLRRNSDRKQRTDSCAC